MATIMVTDDLDEIMDIIKSAIEHQHAPVILLPCSQDFLIHRAAAKLLIRFGIPQNRIGFKQAQLAIVFHLQNPAQSYSGELYPKIAKHLGTGTVKSIEKSIRSTVAAAWENRDDSVWDVFPDYNAPPSNKLFIATLAQMLE